MLNPEASIAIGKMGSFDGVPHNSTDDSCGVSDDVETDSDTVG